MLLTIRTLSCPPPDTPQSIHAQFDADGGRIGRTPPCKLILPDPNRHISREHAEIRFRDNAFSIKVVSKVNSVLVNDAVVSPGEAVLLRDGDQILIGEYLLRADITAAAPAAPPSFFAAPSAPPSASPFDVFDSLGPAAPAPVVAPAPDWFQTPAPPPPPAAAPGGAAAFDEFLNAAPDDSKFSDLLKNATPAATPDAARPTPAAPVDSRLDDFLGLGNPIEPAAPVDASRAGAELYRKSVLDRPLNPASPPPAPSVADFPAADDDIFKALEQDFGSIAPATPVPLPPPVPLPAPAPAQMAPASPLAPPAAVPPAAAAEPLPPVVAPVADLPPGLADLQPPPLASAPAQPPPLATPLAAPPLQQPDQTRQLMAALAESLGLAAGDLDADQPEQTIRLVGELLRMSTDGLFRMLEMRSQLKSELHIEDRTMIASRENNPLKHADSPQDAIAYMVDLRQHGNRLFMPPGKAVEDTIWDICAHEMAVMAGTRAALLAALKMFSPDIVEGRIKKTGALHNVLPALHKSRLWERFLEMYAELEREAEDHFDRLLNQEFSKAYAEQSRKLKKKR